MENENSFVQPEGMLQVASNREVQQVQAAAVLAQKFPRDVDRSFKSVMRACQLPALAEKAIYEFPRGGTSVRGPSIRLAEAIARSWGNLDFGFQELETKPSIGSVPGSSVIMSYCWDLETNTRSTKVFTVRHKRDTKKGPKILTDERDVYEAVANYAMRRVRSNILAIIPKEIVDEAVMECEKTMRKNKEPLEKRIEKAIELFADLDVSKERIEKRLGHKMSATTETEMVRLREIYNSIKDGYASVEDFFEIVLKDVSSITEPTQPPPATAKTEPAKESAPATEAKPTTGPKSIKNYAPQTPEQAENWEPGQTFGETEVHQHEPEPVFDRESCVKELQSICKANKWDNKKVQDLCLKIFNKQTNALTDKELASFLEDLKAQANGGKK